MSEKLLVPKIRFKEFTNAWEQEKLGNLLRYEQPTKYLVSNTDYKTCGIPVLTAGKTFILGYTNEVNGIMNSSKSNPIIIFDDFTTDSHFVQFPFKIKSSAMKLLSNKNEIDNLFFNFLLINKLNYEPESHERHWISKFSVFSITQPSISEKSKISSLFTLLDSLITLHQRKLSSLKNLKNILLDKMFCDEKSQFPSIRFKEFTNAWEQWKIGDLLTERLEFSKQTIDFPLMAFIANEGITPKGERYDRSSLVKDVENKIYKVTKYGDFIYSSNNLDRGSIGANKYGNACISPVYSVFRPTNLSDSRFIEKVLCRNDLIDKILRYRQGVVYGQLRIHESAFLNINLNSPLLPEQHKIGRLLSNLDSLIALHQRKLNSLKNIKNTLLEKMFV
ncbi:restriction endonuclease subunit S [Mycoplasmopsis agalactiae]|nr:restriction endonuclease subunit S [Mycoplasmopsis agalactiae]MCE6056560.1 restriction endonuclease subunit S [Mycoplasmopsis agalactiae]